MDKKSLRIVYMGTPEFAVEPLKTLVESDYNVVAVVTMPDRPAGRGQKIRFSAVKEYALKKKLPVLQPQNLQAEEFLEDLRSYKADLQIVVAFRMLPEVVWDMPPKGTFNLHASLLPQYRGAAPINWAIINGEKETGATTFFIEHQIDTGNIIKQSKISIDENDTVGVVHDKLMVLGAELVKDTVDLILTDKVNSRCQEEIISSTGIELKPAPKIFRETCEVDWNQEVGVVHNFIRGLSPYPAAWSTLVSGDGEEYTVKIYESMAIKKSHNLPIGAIYQEGTEDLKIAVQNGFIAIKIMQLPGKRRLPIADLLRGFTVDSSFKMK